MSEATGYSLSRSPYYRNINKKLLTPCRQMGLPRNRKPSLSISLNDSKNDLGVSSLEETTPVSSKTSTSDSDPTNNLNPAKNSQSKSTKKSTTLQSNKPLKAKTVKAEEDTKHLSPLKPEPSKHIKGLRDSKDKLDLQGDLSGEVKTPSNACKRLLSDDSTSDNSRKWLLKKSTISSANKKLKMIKGNETAPYPKKCKELFIKLKSVDLEDKHSKYCKVDSNNCIAEDKRTVERSEKKLPKTTLSNNESKIIKKQKYIDNTTTYKLESSKKGKELLVRLKSIDLEDEPLSNLKGNTKDEILAINTNILLLDDSELITNSDKTSSKKSSGNIENVPPLMELEVPETSDELLSERKKSGDDFKGFVSQKDETFMFASRSITLDDKKLGNNQSPVKSDKIDKPKRKHIRKLLSMKKTSSNDEDNGVEEIGVLSNSSTSDLPTTSKTENEFMAELKLRDDVMKLETIVNEKQEQLSKLKQASIYQKRHNVGELQNLTKVWQTGCKLALSDLLIQLQRHGSMDMGTLLDNLRIPEALIRLSSDGELI